jgi:homoserine O-acetyltransferase
VIGIKNDVLFPVEEQQYLAKNIPNARFTELDSFYGHDGFLVETEILTEEIGNFFKAADSDTSIVTLHKIA